MPTGDKGGSRVLLRTLRAAMASPGDGQQRLDKVVHLVASNMVAEVCSIYLKRDERTLELCATEGLRKDAVHRVRLRVGQGLVGRIADSAQPLATEDAQNTRGFRYLPETGEEIYQSFVGVPIQRLGEVMGVLVVQNRTARQYTDDEIEALEVVAMVIAEMAEAGAFLGSDGMVTGPGRRVGPILVPGTSASEGIAEGIVHLHEPRLVVFDPIAENIETERRRLADAVAAMRGDIDRLIEGGGLGAAAPHRDIFEAYRMFAYDKGWMKRLEEAVESGLSAEVAVEKVQSAVRARMERATDPYLRERLHDLDDLANRLLRYLVSNGADATEGLPENAVLVARSIGPAELMDHAGRVRAVVLEEGSLSSHAAIVARALNIPMVVQAERVIRDANPGDPIVVDGDGGRVHLRPEPSVITAFREKIDLEREARAHYRAEAGQPATSRDGVTVRLRMNAGILADLPSLKQSGAEGVGLFRTELQFMIRGRMPGREVQAALYSRVLSAAGEREVVFRTLDIGSDKVLPFMRREEEPNPALGWRAIRVALDRPLLFRMQIQSLIRGSEGRPLSVMFPMITEADEYFAARELFLAEVERLVRLGHPRPRRLRLGLMLETPSLVFAPDRLFETADFVSVGGNDLMQFFYAADRENERVRGRYDVLNFSFLDLLGQVVARCARAGTPLSFCGEAAGRPLEALALVATGFRELSMRPASIGPVRRILRAASIDETAARMSEARQGGAASARAALADWARGVDLPV
ncbi:phosphoenolpyruvate--protein phosphotransferase [Limibaculum sp. M0105]|uniref:phosphoenolpyruvate--protein phosphotransferase n=1 Tax=Thermohalobaculum xanthum TaxID=2753746 RepID=A0A8J7SE23_9RHOB|nr:phosphoenolpyruvate--protein phosphotransferase [Thermohalobaculum xanthum]MBK0399226.1 phosphoenolpyruvate--protein phosphotransferase [Thermohalobaculum xanthum]